jgi:hypothetical protein
MESLDFEQKALIFSVFQLRDNRRNKADRDRTPIAR